MKHSDLLMILHTPRASYTNLILSIGAKSYIRKSWDVIIHPCPNLNRGLAKSPLRAQMSYYIYHQYWPVILAKSCRWQREALDIWYLFHRYPIYISTGWIIDVVSVFHFCHTWYLERVGCDTLQGLVSLQPSGAVENLLFNGTAQLSFENCAAIWSTLKRLLGA